MIQVYLNKREIRANIVGFEEGEDGWVDIEDLSVLLSAPTTEVSDPNQAVDETEESLVTPTVKLPTKRLYGNVEVKHIPENA